MISSYDPLFVTASLVVACLVAFAALQLAGRVRSESGAIRRGWLAAGGTVVGIGIWGTHFVGMLALHLPVAIGYDVPLLLLSLLLAIAVSLLALAVINRPELGPRQLIPGAILIGGGVAGVQYVGMASMRMDAAVRYSPWLVAASVFVAVVATVAGLRLAFRFRSDLTVRGTLLKVFGAIILGAALSGMHYTAMTAARFVPGESLAGSMNYLVGSGELGETVVEVTILILAIALIAAAIDRSIQMRNAYADGLRDQASQTSISEQQYRLLFEHNPSPMWVYDNATRAFLAVNEAAIHRYGYTREEFLSMTRRDIRVADSQLPERGAASEPVIVEDPAWNGQHRKKDGSVIEVAVTSNAIAFDGHQACLALALDVTDPRRAEEALRQSELRTRLIIDTALDAVVTMNSSGVISDWSAQAESMFGWSRAEAVGQLMSETIVPLRYREAHNRGLKKFLTTGEGPVLNRRIEVTGLSRDGREFPIELAISPAKVGDTWTFSAFIRDLTERRRAEEALRQEERRYRELFEDVPVGLYRSTPEGGLIDANPAMVSMLGFPDRESLLATPAPALYVNPEDRIRWSAQMKGEGAVLDFEVRMRRADGAVIWARDTTHVKRGPDGTVLLYEGVLEEITGRVEAERALQANERRLIQILEAVPIGIFVSDAAGTSVFANGAAQKMLGSGVIPGRGVGDLAQTNKAYVAGTDEVYPPDRMPLLKALNGVASSVDDVEVRESGRVVSLAIQGAPILDSDGKVIGAVVALNDSTGRKTLESQLRQTSKMEAVGQLAGGVAHDFNNLLTVIMSYGAMLLERLDPADSNREDVQEIAAAADRAAGLTRQLLAFSRQQVMQPRVVSINAVIGDLEKMLGRLIGEDIQLTTSLDPGLATIYADPGQLEQVLMNLVVNARDAMPAGGQLSICTSNSELSAESATGALHAADGDYVMLAVSDTGTGMTREVQQRLFEPFFTTKESGRGTGLGLATVYGIVNQSGGEIYVYSAVGEGSTIKVYFPRYAAKAEERPYEVKSRDTPLGTEKILLVEDDDNLRGLLARVLRKCGYSVIVAGGGLEALALVSDPEVHIDGVITDVVMPGMNGRELVDKLIESRPHIASLLMSGYTDDEVLRRGVLHGDMAFLQKPFTPDQLARKVRDVLDHAIVAPT
jgi:PAS domain S-box-containing protein